MASALRVRLLLLLVVLLGIGASRQLAVGGDERLLRANLRSIPLNFADVTGLEDQIDARTLDVLQASQTLNRQYFQGEDKYWLFVGYFAQQRFGSQIHSPRHCYPGSGWNILDSKRSRRLGGPTGELLIQKDKEQRVVLYQYLTRGGNTTSEYRLKFELIRNSLLGRPLDAAFVRFSTPLGKQESEAEALERLGRFARRLAPSIQPALPF